MLTRPTTPQILEDCRRELAEVIAPAVEDPAVAISLSMLDEVLRNCAVRAAHEIAWMHEEGFRRPDRWVRMLSPIQDQPETGEETTTAP